MPKDMKISIPHRPNKIWAKKITTLPALTPSEILDMTFMDIIRESNTNNLMLPRTMTIDQAIKEPLKPEMLRLMEWSKAAHHCTTIGDMVTKIDLSVLFCKAQEFMVLKLDKYLTLQLIRYNRSK
jgi:hypothetical protein